MDIYEHAYAIDYGAAAAKYLDASFANVRRDAVNRRLEQARQVNAGAADLIFHPSTLTMVSP